MSREVLGIFGDLPDDDPVGLLRHDLERPGQPLLSAPPKNEPELLELNPQAGPPDEAQQTRQAPGDGAVGGRPGRRLIAALAAAFALGAALGGTGAGAFDTSNLATEGALSAVVTAVGARGVAGPGDSAAGTVTLTIRNAAFDVAQVSPPTAADQVSYAVRISDRDPVEIPPGGAASVTFEVVMFCQRPLGLGLAPLRVERGNSGQLRVPVLGGQAEVTRQCALLDKPLIQAEARADGDRLAVQLWVPSGRTERVNEIWAGSEQLLGHPLPVRIASTKTTIWLDPPARCSPDWAGRGIPVGVRLVTGTRPDDGPAILDVPVGRALSEWLLQGPCR